MRLVVVGNLDGRFVTAARIAMEKGAPVRHVDRIETALALLQPAPEQEPGADIVMIDVASDIRGLSARLQAMGLAVPIVACGTGSEAGITMAAVHAGAREYIPLPPDPEMIAAILAAVADDRHDPGPAGFPQTADRERGKARGAHPQKATRPAPAAKTVTHSLVGRTVADVERDLILETLRRCLGNRTHAAGMLGISVRTLRNKLTVYAAEGIDVPPPNAGEIRGAA